MSDPGKQSATMTNHTQTHVNYRFSRLWMAPYPWGIYTYPSIPDNNAGWFAVHPGRGTIEDQMTVQSRDDVTKWTVKRSETYT